MDHSVSQSSLPFNVTMNISKDHNDMTGPSQRLRSFECSYLHTLTFPNGSSKTLESNEQQETIRNICFSITILSDVFFWLAVVLGIPGNLAAVITLTTMPKSTCTFYIALLAVLDLSAIVLKMIMRLLSTHGVRLGDVGCKTLLMASNFIVTYANWVLVLICLERFVTIRFPLKKPIYFTIKRARYSAVFLAGCLFPFILIVPFIYEESPPSSSRLCRTNKELKELSRIWRQAMTILYSFVPSILLFVHIGLITFALKQHKKRRELIMENSPNDEISLRLMSRATTNSHSANQRQQLDKLERSITGMLLVAAIVFIVLTLPICVLMVMPYDHHNDTPESYARWKLHTTLARALVLMTHALNCYIYFVTCKKFRGHLFGGISKLFGKVPTLRRQSTTATTRVQVTEILPYNNHH